MLNKLWILCCLFTTVNCMGTETDNPTAPEGIDFVRSDKAYLKSVDVPSADQASLQEGNLAFALDLYREIASGASADDNLFISPHSVSTLMAMTYAGARGNTQSQISAALQFNLAKEALHPAMNGLTQRLAAIGDAEESFVFEPLNSLWLQRDYQVQTGFLDILSQHYDTGVYQADFEREAAESRRSINQWISEATHGNI
jgi:serpin B